MRYCITGGAVKYEKVGQQMQHNPRSARGSRWVSTVTAALGARARGGGSDTAVAATCGTAQIGGSSCVIGRIDELGCFYEQIHEHEGGRFAALAVMHTDAEWDFRACNGVW